MFWNVLDVLDMRSQNFGMYWTLDMFGSKLSQHFGVYQRFRTLWVKIESKIWNVSEIWEMFDILGQNCDRIWSVLKAFDIFGGVKTGQHFGMHWRFWTRCVKSGSTFWNVLEILDILSRRHTRDTHETQFGEFANLGMHWKI